MNDKESQLRTDRIDRFKWDHYIRIRTKIYQWLTEGVLWVANVIVLQNKTTGFTRWRLTCSYVSQPAEPI